MTPIPSLISMALVASAARNEAHLLVEGSQPRATVVLSAQASVTERHAAAELIRYVQRISGAEWPRRTVGEKGAGPRIFVGLTSRWAEFGLADPPPALHEEGFVLRTVGDDLLLSGRSERGLLFAVYHFLEQVLGCRWLVPGELGEVVPQRATISVPPLNVVENPAFDLRWFGVSGQEEGQEWAVRNRLNGLVTPEFAEAHGGMFYFQPGVAGFHSFFQLLPADEYFQAYPDIFPLLGGERRPYSLRSGQLCTTNPKTEDLMVRVLLDYFTAHPQARLVSISPNDGYGWCECEACRAFDEKYAQGRRTANGQPVTTDRLLDFLNRVLARVHQQFPDKQAVTLSYVNYVEPPSTFRPGPNLTVFQCHYTPACYAHPITDPTCPQNVAFDQHLRRWLEVAPESLGLYAYTDKSMWFYLPRPVTRPMAADIRHFQDLGVRGYYAQSNAGEWALNLPLYYVTARLLWNPNLDVDALRADFFEHFFGTAAEPMQAFYRTFEDAVTASGAHFNAHPLAEAPLFLTPEVMEAAATHLAAAEAQAETAAVRARLAAVRAQFDRNMQLWNVIWHYHCYNQTGEVEELRPVKALLPDLIKAWGEGSYFAQTFTPILWEAEHDGILWSDFGPEEEKGGRTCRNSDETGPGDHAAGWATFRFWVPDLTKPVKLTLTVWGESALSSLVICTKGQGAGRSSGGVWNPVAPEPPLSGRPQWEELVFLLPPELFEPDIHRQIVGFGGGDSQVWVAAVKVEQEEK